MPMNVKPVGRLIRALLFLSPAMGTPVFARADPTSDANNPLAKMVAFNIQQYFIGEQTKSDEAANQFWLRYAKPFEVLDSHWLFRGSLPLNSYPSSAAQTETGVGDLNLFASYLFNTKNPAVSFGLGPQITAPTATDKVLGSGKWSGGLVNILFDGRSNVFQFGYLLTWQASFAGQSDRADVNLGAFQPFLFYQLGKGRYLRSAPIMAYNFDNDTYSVPLGVGVGQVVPAGKTVFNVFLEPQFSVADKGPGWPAWQIFFGLNMQFVE